MHSPEGTVSDCGGGPISVPPAAWAVNAKPGTVAGPGVIVVGARCAGAPLAMLLARSGARVLLVDRATFPSDIPHGHYIHRHGPRQLRSWHLLDHIAARTPAITRGIFDMGDVPLLATDLVEDGVPWGFGPRRTTLDKILVDAATQAGAELREGFVVTNYTLEDVAWRGSVGSREAVTLSRSAPR